jgi:formamidopyrimidine-DNA glycosylase
MPELPEVETVVRFLRPFVVGKIVAGVEPAAGFEKVLATHAPVDFGRLVTGRTVRRTRRRGKYIVLDLDRGHLLIHLRMTGRLLTRISDNDNPRHITARIDFTDGTCLYFKDYRKFGRLYYYRDLSPLEQQLGPEPLSEAFTPDWFFGQLHHRQRALKPLLLDQSFLAGLGNIYVDEALWAARLHPLTTSNRVSRIKANRLHRAIREILQASIEMQGTTIINFYFGERGEGRGQFPFPVAGFRPGGRALPALQHPDPETARGPAGNPPLSPLSTAGATAPAPAEGYGLKASNDQPQTRRTSRDGSV